MKKIITICFLLISAGNSFAQQITFQKIYGGQIYDEGASVQQTSDGGYVMTGRTAPSSAPSVLDIGLIKTNSNGDTIWTRTFGGPNGEIGYSVQQTTDGGYIVVGTTSSFGAGSSDVLLIKTDANGDTLWIKTYGGIDSDKGNVVQQTTDSGYIIGGQTDAGIYLIKTNTNGDTLWTKTFGGSTTPIQTSIRQTTDGGYIITGQIGFTITGHAYLMKTDSIGNLLWLKTYGGTSNDIGNSVQQTSDGGFIVLGTTVSFGAGYEDIYVIKTNNMGDTLWTKTFGGTYVDGGSSIQQTVDGGYIIVGSTFSGFIAHGDIYLIKTDSLGNLVWSKTFGGSDEDGGQSVQQTTDGGYIIGGSSRFSFSTGNAAYLIKTDSLGNSGCNESNLTTIVTTPLTQVTTPSINAVYYNTIVTTPVIEVGSGSTVTTLCSTVGINETPPQEELILFPNPFSDKINITTKTNEPLEITLFDITARKLLHQQFTNSLTLNTAQLAKGMYLYEVINNKGVIKKGKVIKE